MKRTLRILLSLISMIAFGISLSAQTPSQKRKMQQNQDDQSDQKNLSNSQKRQLKKLDQANDKIFGDDDPGFNVKTAPDKWKNESAVVLDQNIQFEYYTESHMYTCDEYVRKRILLLDKSAVEENSTFSFLPNQEVGFRVIKKDGTIKKVSVLDAVDVKEGLPTSYSLFGRSTASLYSSLYSGYKKLAVPDLQPGDIIDYYYKYTDASPMWVGTGQGSYKVKFNIFPVNIFTLPEEYPILKQSVVFYVEKGYYVNFSASNGAPSLKQSELPDKKTEEFSLTDENREKKVEERWKYPYRSEPTIKFQVVYSTDGEKDDLPYFLGDNPFVPMTKVPHDLLQGVADQIAMEKSDIATKLANETISYMKSEHKNLKDPIKYMEYAYYYMRFFLMVQKRRDYENHSTAFFNQTYEYAQYIPKDPTDPVFDEAFIKAMGLIARDNNISYELLFAEPRFKGTLDNIVLRDDMSWLIKIKGPHDMLMYPFSTFRNPEEAQEEMEAVDAYSIIPNKDSKKVVMNKASIPLSPYTSNVYAYTLDVTLNPAIDGSMSIARNATITGLAKESYYPDVLVDDIYQNQELKKYNQKTDLEEINHIKNEKEKATELTRYKNALDDDFKKRLDEMKDKVKDDYDVDSYDEFNLICGGIEMDSTKLIFNDKFKIKSLTKKAGPNYVFEVGKLIGAQVELKDKDSVRTNDIYMAFARETDNEFDINIPAGYKVDGIDALNMNVTNSTGGFVSTAKMNGNKLVITTKKYYASDYEPKSSWHDMYRFLKAGYDFSQKKVLLKKA